MSIATRTAIIRFGRVVGYGALAGAVGVALDEIAGGAFDGTTVGTFAIVLTALLTAADKYLREKRAGF